MPPSPLVKAILQMSDSGPNGFEGLMRDLLQKVTDKEWRLLKSGTQLGADIVCDGEEIVAEVKKYSTRLPLDALKSKLRDAIDHRPKLALWILGTTQFISGDDATELQRVGEEQGVSVLIIDHQPSPSSPSQLGILCGCAPDVVRQHLTLSPKAKSELSALASHRNLHDALRAKLHAADTGFDAARQVIADRLRRVMAARSEARHYLGSPADLLGQARVSRPAISAAISEWWAAGPNQEAVLLGDEGLGKTWAALAWWHETAGSDGSGLPPTVVLPAHRLPVGGLGDLLGHALHEATATRSTAFWRRRAERWVEAADGPCLLIILDGLNQAWEISRQRWHDLLMEARTEPWLNRVALLLTCRPDHWDSVLGGLTTITPAPHRIRIDPFSNDERDGLLKELGHEPGSFAPRVLELMRVPRLCSLAVKHGADLDRSEDVTPERLIAIDWRHRLESNGEHGLIGLEEFQDFAAELGRSVRDAVEQGAKFGINRRGLIEALGRDSGHGREDLHSTLSEIIDGRWLRKESAHVFTVTPELTPFVLGLALVRHLSNLTERTAVEERLADFMDPLNGQDFAVQILAAAVTVALQQQELPVPVVHALTDEWIRSRNFSFSGFETWWRLASAHPETFLDQAERLWLRKGTDGSIDEAFVKGLARAAGRNERAKEQLVKRVTDWLSVVWEDPRQGEFLGNVEDAESEERREITRRAFEFYKAHSQHHEGLPTLRLVPDGFGWAWLAHRAFGILSFLPRAPFMPAVTAWAMARTVAGSAEYTGSRSRAAWVLRLNTLDHADARHALDEAVRNLRSSKEPTCQDAADLMLRCTGSGAAATGEEPPPSFRDTVNSNAATGLVEWDHATAKTWKRCQQHPLDATMGLATYAVDPEATLSQTSAEELVALVRDVEPAVEPDGRDGCGLETAWLPLARWAPDALADYLRRRLGLLEEETVTDRTVLLGEIPGQLSLLDPATVGTVRRATTKADGADREADLLTYVHLLLDLKDQPAAEQIARLRQAGDQRPAVEAISFLLAAPAEDDFELLSTCLEAASPATDLCWWLEYMARVSLELMPPGYAPVANLLKHQETEVRAAAFRVARTDEELMRLVAESNWSAADAESTAEALEGSQVLLEATDETDPTAYAARLRCDALAPLVEHLGASPAVLNAYQASLTDRLDELLQSRNRTLSSRCFIETKGAQLLARNRPGDATRLLEEFSGIRI